MAAFTIQDGGVYYNKGYRCIWVKQLDGTTHKFIVGEPEGVEPLALPGGDVPPEDEKQNG